MKVFTQFLIKVSLMVAAVFLTTVGYSAVFTATASGDFSSSATWSGGIVPPTTLTSDMIVIPLGIAVTLDEALTIDGPLAQLDVTGSLVTDTESLVMIEGILSGTGTISLNSIDLKSGTTFLFTGVMNAKDLNVDATFASTADMAIEETLVLQSGDMSLTNGGSLSFSPDARLMLSGGTLTLAAGGLIDLSTDYNVRYNSSSFTTGVELSGSGLKDLEVDMTEGSTLTLSSDVTLAGTLALDGGTFALADHDLVINGDVTSSSSGKISSTSLSDITLNAMSSTTGALTFEAASELKDLIINLPPENAAKIEGFLRVQGDLILNSGILKMDNADVSINGDISGSGILSATPTTNLTINTTGELSTALRFDTEGQTLNNFSVSVGADNELTLASGLNVKGDLAIMDESILKINGTNLILDAESTLSGTGRIGVDGYSSLTINSTAGIDALRMDGMIGDLTINTSETSTVNLASDANVSGTLTLQSGTMRLNDYDLAVMGDVAASGTGKINTTSASDVTFSSGTSGILTFDGGSVVKTLTVDAGADVNVKISGDVTIDSLLKLSSGVMHMSDASLTINGDITGSGMFSSIDADMTISSTAILSESLRFTADGQTLNSLTIDMGENNKVVLGSDLRIDAMLSLTDGSGLDISGRTLVLDSESNLTGTGFIKVDSTSSLTINSTTDISSLKLDGTLGDLTINSVDGTVRLTGDANVDGTFTMASGELDLNKNDLSVFGNISTIGTGTLSTTADSDIKIETNTSTAGALRFSSTANTVGNMTVKIADNGSAAVETDLTIAKSLNLQGGTLDINDQTLVMSSTGIIVGASSTSYIRTDAGGEVEMEVVADGSTVIFPVGTVNAYAPAEVTLNAGSEGGKIQVGVSADVFAGGTAGADLSATEPLVDATWQVQSDIATELDMNLRVMWPSSNEVNGFNRTDAFISNYTNGEWDSSTRIAATAEANGMFSLERTGLTSFGAYAVFDANTITATEDVTDDFKLRIYPNPAVESIIIQNTTPSTDHVNMEIISSTGQLMGQYRLTKANTTVSVKELTHGHYFIRFYNKDLNSTKQFTKI